LGASGGDANSDPSGHPLCELCSRRLDRCKGKLYQHGAGKICKRCYNIQNGLQAPPVSPRGTPLHDTEDQRCPHGVPASRSKRPYHTLQPTQKWERKKQLAAAVADVEKQIGCPLSIIPSPTHANPIKTTQHFAALLVHEGGDSWLELQDCRAPGLTPFIGDSAAFPHIWAVLQHLIDTKGAFLNGDWPFINAVLGLMAPGATHPCPICIVSHNNYLHSSRYRTSADKHSCHPQQSALLTIPPERIVPTPLHLFLGISNRIILDAFSELLGKERVEAALKPVTTVHSAGCTGKSDMFDLNGPEIRKWIKRGCSESLLAAAAATSALPAATRATHSILSRWLEQLHDFLLHKGVWNSDDIESWRSVVDDIWQHWCAETSQAAFPKLHMLRHSLEFAERHRFLGRASEAQIESFHAQFNTLFHDHHLNQGSNTSERMRRSLADAALRAVQLCLSPAEP